MKDQGIKVDGVKSNLQHTFNLCLNWFCFMGVTSSANYKLSPHVVRRHINVTDSTMKKERENV